MDEADTKYQALLDEEGSVPQTGDDGSGEATPSLTAEERLLHAAHYLYEGRTNIKFASHPKDTKALEAAKIANGVPLNLMDLMGSVFLMALALFEQPAVWPLPITATCILELSFLFCLLIHSGFYYRWKGKRSLYEPRLLIKHILIIEMVIESLVILIRQEHHVRFMRLFRPFFLVANRYSKGVKRVIREMIESLPPVLDVMVLLLMFVTTFSVFGFYVFGIGAEGKDPYTDDLKNWYFEDLAASWVNLFILLTTANYPDVMMPAYKKSQFAALFFIFFLLFGLYFIGNLLLAAVCNNFNKKEKKKFGRLYCHQRRGLRLAFEVLDKDNKSQMDWETFQGLLTRYNRWMSRDNIVITFHALDVGQKGYLTLEDFFQLFSQLNCTWRPENSKSRGLLCGFDRYPPSWKPPLEQLRKIVQHNYFEYFIDFCIVVNAAFIVAEAALKSYHRHLLDGYEEAFLVLYCFEAVIKITSLGFLRYIKNGFNKFDFVIVVVGVIGTLVEVELVFVTILRPFRLLRLIRLRKSFLYILASMFNLLPKMGRFVATLFCFYYVFSIIGMESFEGLISKCGCVRIIYPQFHNKTEIQCYPELFTTNGSYVRDYGQINFTCPDGLPCSSPPPSDTHFALRECAPEIHCTVLQCGRYYGSYYDRSAADGLYYLNNFDNVINSYVTLFELMIINNWHVTMQGTVDAVRHFRPGVKAETSRIFFIMFYLATVIVVINVVVAFILGAFESLLPVMKRKYLTMDFQEDPTVSMLEIDKEMFLERMGEKTSKKARLDYYTDEFRFVGRRNIKQLDVYLALFGDEIKEWEDKESKEAAERKPDQKKWYLAPKVSSSPESVELTSPASNEGGDYEPPSEESGQD